MHAHAWICMHIHAYACTCACKCIPMHAYACICMRGDPMGGASGGFTKQNERFRPELLILSSKSGGCIHAYVCMHIHAYACICACICIHMHAYACVEIPWGAQVVVLLSKMKGSGLNCSFYQAIVAGVYGHAYACISMHMHADAYAYAYVHTYARICMHMHAWKSHGGRKLWFY